MTRGSDVKKTLDSNDVNIKVISNYKNLVSAYESIKSNPGNMTQGTNKETLDGVSKDYIERIQKLIKAGKFQFNPARRTQIPKPGKTETRPLTIASPREKVVQKAMLLVLERFYDKEFLDSSHGFRPGRGTHTAIKQVESLFQSASYIIEADFSKAFDSIPHKELMNIIGRDIKCIKTLGLLKSALTAGYVEFGTLHDQLVSGTPQGSIISPLLCNIFLNELDVYMEEIKSQYQRGTKRRLNQEYVKYQNQSKYWKARGYDKTRPELYRKLINKLLSLDSK